MSVSPALPCAAPPEAGAAPVTPEKRDPLEYVSASRLNTWLQCQLKFYFRYVAGIEKPLTPALHIGRTVHAALQLWNLSRWRGDDYKPEALWPRFCQDWDQDQDGHDIDWGGDEESVKAHTWSMVKTYLEQTPIPGDERPEGVEVHAEMDLANRGLPRLVGILDLVRAGGVIVDFKTSASTPNARQVALTTGVQLNCYALLYREATGRRESGFELHHLVKNKTPKIVVTKISQMDARQELRMFRILENYVKGVIAGEFVPSPGLQCGFCQYVKECRQWC